MFLAFIGFGLSLFLLTAIATLFVISKPLDAFDVNVDDPGKDGKQ
jgi:hypothetical protein